MKGMQLLAKFVKPFQQNSHLKWYGYEIILSKHCEQILSRTFHFAVSVLLLQLRKKRAEHPVRARERVRWTWCEFRSFARLPEYTSLVTGKLSDEVILNKCKIQINKSSLEGQQQSTLLHVITVIRSILAKLANAGAMRFHWREKLSTKNFSKMFGC